MCYYTALRNLVTNTTLPISTTSTTNREVSYSKSTVPDDRVTTAEISQNITDYIK